jgi:hypothetical protein
MSRHLVTAIASLVLLGACATPAGGSREGWTVPLAASRSAAGGVARATMLPAGDTTRVELFFSAAGPAPTIPLHVYTYLYEGSCAQLPTQPVLDLNDTVLVHTATGEVAQTRRGAFTLSHRVDLPLATVAGGRYALALHAAPADGGELLYCGDLRRS